MAVQQLLDRMGRLLGRLTDSEREERGYDAAGHYRGRYDKRNRSTYDAQGGWSAAAISSRA